VSHIRKIHGNWVITRHRKAQKLFSSKEEAMTFAEDYGFDDAHVELLRTSGMILESAKVLANNGKITDAIKSLIDTPTTPDRTRRAVEYLLTGLWRYQSFGTDYPTTNADVVSELLTLANTLGNDMHEQEAREVRSTLWFGMALKSENTGCNVQSKIQKRFQNPSPSAAQVHRSWKLFRCLVMPRSRLRSLPPSPSARHFHSRLWA
jgi:hypothetical protein